LGPKVDSFDGDILRFNNYETVGYEDYVGSRTNFLAQRSCSDIKKRPLSEIDMAFLFVTYCPLKMAMRGAANPYLNHYLNKAVVVPSTECVKTHVRCGYMENLVTEARKCSIGILAVDYFIRQGYEVYLYGWYQDTTKHYFKRQPLDDKYHDFAKEQQLIDEFIKQQKCFIWKGD